MTQSDPSRWLAALLVAVGLFLLAATSGWFGEEASWFWAAALLASSAGFLYVRLRHPAFWWALIPGFGLFGLALETLMRGTASGILLLGFTGVGLIAVYLSGLRRWWALIPGGTLLTLALDAWVGATWPTLGSDWLFFLGLSATFGALAGLPERLGKQRWAIFPALGALALALTLVVSNQTASVLFPLLLIALAALQLGRSRRPRRAPGAPRE